MKYKMNFEGAYLHDCWADSSQIWNGRYSTLREYLQQKWFVFCLGITELWMCKNGGSYIIHICLSHAHTAHYCVS